MDDNSFLYYLRGQTAAYVMIKGAIHPDMHEENFGEGSNILVDFGAEVKTYKFPDELDVDKVRQLTEALFPPTEKIVKSFKLMSWFRAGFLEMGGELAAAVMANASHNNLSSFPYCKAHFDTKAYDATSILCDETKRRMKEWKRIMCKDLGLEKTPRIDYAAIPSVIEKTKGRNLYYVEQISMIFAIIGGTTRSAYLMHGWISALHFACRSIEEGFLYTGYGILRKVLHWCGQALAPIVAYHAKIEEMLESRTLREDVKEFIEDCTKYEFMQFLWIVNDIDTFVA